MSPECLHWVQCHRDCCRESPWKCRRAGPKKWRRCPHHFDVPRYRTYSVNDFLISMQPGHFTLNHDILMKKLHYHGVRNNTLNWFHCYLTNRAQYTEYNETKSSLLEIETGVPQESILGPLLFLIYVNDIHMVSRSFNFMLYADDTTLTSPICSFTQGGNSSISKVSNLINSELTKISDWFAVNKLSLNAEKTKFMIFHNHQKIITQNKIPCLKINNTNIERVTEFNFLGLTINEHLTWKSHAAKVANKISRTLGLMNRLKRYLPLSALIFDIIPATIRYHVFEGLNGTEFSSCRNVLFVSWQTANITPTLSLYSRS